MINIGSRRECFWDTYLIDTEKSTAEIRLNKPVSREIVMEYPEDWGCNVSYINLFHDNGIYRMYYMGWNKDRYLQAEPGSPDKSMRVCYAESKDGLRWIKPELGIVEWAGSKKNNILFSADWLDNFYVFRDDNPYADPKERYKAVVQRRRELIAFVSPDGIHFTESHVITNKGSFDSLNTVLWDAKAQKYRGYFRSFHNIPVEGGDFLDLIRNEMCEAPFREKVKEHGLEDLYAAVRRGEPLPEMITRMEAVEKINEALRELVPEVDIENWYVKVLPGIEAEKVYTPEGYLRRGPLVNMGIRDIRYIESEDFRHWSEPIRLDYGDKADFPMYTNNVSIYERAPHMFIGFPTRYTERQEWTKAYDVLCGQQARKYRMEKWEKREGLAITDCLFMCSRDGVHFTRYDEAFLKNGPENGYNWVYGDCYPAHGLVVTDSDMEGADREINLFCKENFGNRDRMRRYVLRQDGFCSLHAGEKEKVLVTKPFVFEGSNLIANMATSAYGYMYFSLEDTQGNRIQSCEMFGDSIDKTVGFEGDLSAFSGKEVVMTVRMRDADLYAMKFE